MKTDSYCHLIQDGDSTLVWRRAGSGQIEIVDIDVPNSQRRRGIGRSMVDFLIANVGEDCRLVYAITRVENSIAQEFYEGLKFVIIGVLRDFYSDNSPAKADALVYGKRLKVS